MTREDRERVEQLAATLEFVSGTRRPAATPIMCVDDAAIVAPSLRALLARVDELEDERDDFRDRLHDLVMIDSEEWATGGGPGFKDRKDKAWSRAREPFEP